MESLPLQIPPGYPSHQASRLPPGLTLPSALPLLSRHTLPAAAPASVSPHLSAFLSGPSSSSPPPSHPPAMPHPAAASLSPPGALSPPRKTPSIRALGRFVPGSSEGCPALAVEEAPRTWGALTPASTETRVHTRTGQCGCTSPTSPHTRTQPRHRHTHTQTHSHSHSHTLHRTRRCTCACTCELPHHQGGCPPPPSSPGWETAGWPPEYRGFAGRTGAVCQLQEGRLSPITEETSPSRAGVHRGSATR